MEVSQTFKGRIVAALAWIHVAAILYRCCDRLWRRLAALCGQHVGAAAIGRRKKGRIIARGTPTVQDFAARAISSAMNRAIISYMISGYTKPGYESIRRCHGLQACYRLINALRLG